MSQPPSDRFLPGCLLLDLETSQSGQILKIGAARDSHAFLRIGRFDVQQALRELDVFAADAICLVGHNVLQHDLAVLDERLKTDPEHFPESPVLEEFRSLIEKRRGLLRGHAFNLGKRLYSEKPKRLSKRFGDYWQAERRLSLDTLCDRARPVPDSR